MLKEVGYLENLVIDGVYYYNVIIFLFNIDIIVLNIFGQLLVVQLYGFLVCYMFVFKDNYFGEDVYFKMLEEY